MANSAGGGESDTVIWLCTHNKIGGIMEFKWMTYIDSKYRKLWILFCYNNRPHMI